MVDLLTSTTILRRKMVEQLPNINHVIGGRSNIETTSINSTNIIMYSLSLAIEKSASLIYYNQIPIFAK